MLTTEQQVFDVVVEHLMTQGAVSWSCEFNGCVYRSADGKKCAIGCLIPDSKYSPSLEGLPSTGPEVLEALKETVQISPKIVNLLMELQRIHDNIAPSGWSHKLLVLGIDRGYDLTVIFETRDKLRTMS
jgi:hypothetical protein